MLKGEPFETDVLDKTVLIEVAFDTQQDAELGRSHVGGRHVFAFARPVVEHAGFRMQVPFAGRIERFPVVLDEVARMGIPVADGHPEGPANRTMRLDSSISLDPVQRRGPGVIEPDVDVFPTRPGFNLALVIPEPDFLAGSFCAFSRGRRWVRCPGQCGNSPCWGFVRESRVDRSR